MSIFHYFANKHGQTLVHTTPATNISLARYMGRWYEQARFENWFEAGMEAVCTDYRLRHDGRVEVLNCGINAKGKQKQSRGLAVVKGEGILAVSFVPPYFWFRAPYHILYVDPEYRSALVSGIGSDYLWLLTREVQPEPSLLTELLRQARLRGFNTEQLRVTRHV